MTAMSANSLYAETFKILSGGPIFSLPRLLLFIVCSVLVRLGYFIGLSKSVPVPQTRIRFIGFLSDSILQAFLIPQDKRIKFASLRDSILQRRTVSIKTLQRFAGKVTSFSLAVPAAQLYAREVYRAISLANRSSRPIKVVGDLRSKIAHWRFFRFLVRASPLDG